MSSKYVVYLQNLQAIFPNAAFKCLRATVLERADALLIQVAALEGFLVAPCLVEVLGLEKANKASVRSVVERGLLVFAVQVAPLVAFLDVFLLNVLLTHGASELSDAKVVVGVLQSAANTTCQSSETFVVKVLDWDIAKRIPRVDAASAMAAPVKRFYLSIFSNGGQTLVPINAVTDTLEVSIGKNIISVGTTLSVSAAEGHAAIWQPAIMLICGDKGAHHLGDGIRIQNGKEGQLRAEEIPNAVKGIEVGPIVPRRVLTSIVLRTNHGAIDSRVKVCQKGLVDSSSLDLDWQQLVFPLVLGVADVLVEVKIGHFLFGIGASLLLADEAHADTGVDGVATALKANEGASRQRVAVDGA